MILLHMENVLVSPHVASATTMRPETRRRVGREVALVLRNKWPMSCVNPAVLPRVPLERWQPYPEPRSQSIVCAHRSAESIIEGGRV